MNGEAGGRLETMTFDDYLGQVRAHPGLARLSHARIHDMILAAGVGGASDGGPRYRFFENDLFGSDSAVREVVDYFAAAARRLDMRRRILLLVGPPGSGKSTLVNALKRGLSRYTGSPEGALYAIQGCPIREEPLHLLPPERRLTLSGVHVEGGLCPYCDRRLRELHGGDPGSMPVERVTFSAAAGIGIGTFVPSDPGSEDLTRLVGFVDRSLLGAPIADLGRAYVLDGELDAANRGLADLVDVLKMDERFLAVLLIASEEQLIKVNAPGLFSVDEAILAQSNLAEYAALADTPTSAALRDRMVVVRLGYVLSVTDEVRIYRKLLGGADLEGLHLSPLALPTAATVAVLSRLKGGQKVRELRAALHDHGRDGAIGEGSFSGLSPRYVLTQLSNLLARGPGCLTGTAVLQGLRDGLRQSAMPGERDVQAWSALFEAATAEHDEAARLAVRRALVPDLRASIDALVRDARAELERWAEGAGEEELPTLGRVEDGLRIASYQRRGFRASLRDDQPQASLTEEAERLLLPTWDQARRMLADDGSMYAERLEQRLITEGGFCDLCAHDLVEHTRALDVGRARREPAAWRFRLLGG